MMGTSTRQILFWANYRWGVDPEPHLGGKGIVRKSRKVITHLWVPPLGHQKMSFI